MVVNRSSLSIRDPNDKIQVAIEVRACTLKLIAVQVQIELAEHLLEFEVGVTVRAASVTATRRGKEAGCVGVLDKNPYTTYSFRSLRVRQVARPNNKHESLLPRTVLDTSRKTYVLECARENRDALITFGSDHL